MLKTCKKKSRRGRLPRRLVPCGASTTAKVRFAATDVRVTEKSGHGTDQLPFAASRTTKAYVALCVLSHDSGTGAMYGVHRLASRRSRSFLLQRSVVLALQLPREVIAACARGGADEYACRDCGWDRNDIAQPDRNAGDKVGCFPGRWWRLCGFYSPFLPLGLNV